MISIKIKKSVLWTTCGFAWTVWRQFEYIKRPIEKIHPSARLVLSLRIDYCYYMNNDQNIYKPHNKKTILFLKMLTLKIVF